MQQEPQRRAGRWLEGWESPQSHNPSNPSRWRLYQAFFFLTIWYHAFCIVFCIHIFFTVRFWKTLYPSCISYVVFRILDSWQICRFFFGVVRFVYLFFIRWYDDQLCSTSLLWSFWAELIWGKHVFCALPAFFYSTDFSSVMCKLFVCVAFTWFFCANFCLNIYCKIFTMHAQCRGGLCAGDCTLQCKKALKEGKTGDFVLISLWKWDAWKLFAGILWSALHCDLETCTASMMLMHNGGSGWSCLMDGLPGECNSDQYSTGEIALCLLMQLFCNEIFLYSATSVRTPWISGARGILYFSSKILDFGVFNFLFGIRTLRQRSCKRQPRVRRWRSWSGWSP